ncbi:hypothetical protein JCM10212_001745 [Sporobolomyces blumeae]
MPYSSDSDSDDHIASSYSMAHGHSHTKVHNRAPTVTARARNAHHKNRNVVSVQVLRAPAASALTPGDSKTPSGYYRTRRTGLEGTPLDSTSVDPTAQPPTLPRASYWRGLDIPSTNSASSVEPKSRLLVSDLDNTLFGPSGDGIVARPYLRTFIKYLQHPSTPYALAIWTFSGKMWGQAHLRQAGVGDLLFEDDDVAHPELKGSLKVMWGFEQSGFLPSPPYPYGSMASGYAVKDLELMWELLNIQGGSNWTPQNSLIVDDQISNGRAQPDNIVVCPYFSDKSPDDDFLLAFIGLLDELAPASNFAAVIKAHEWRKGIALNEIDRYVERGKTVCRGLDIRVTRGTPYHDPAIVERVNGVVSPSSVAPVHDAAEEPVEPHPASFEDGQPTPKRVAKGMTLTPSADYLALAAEQSEIGKVGKPLIVFDLDGTLYRRPPQNLEHDPNGEPVGRPYLRTFLTWLLRPESPWSVAIWTGSQNATAVRCLSQLGLGLVGSDGKILHPKLKALWAREDFGLTPEDFVSYVAIVKDLDKMWDHLRKSGAGDWNARNTVMVDDTPEKLRAQPDSLLAATSFQYPRAEPDAASTDPPDAFFLALVAQLEELAPESNFSNYISSEGWNKVMSERDEKKRADRGLSLLREDGITVSPAGRGAIPGVPTTVQGATRNKSPTVFKTSTDPSAPLSQPQRLTLAALSRVPNEPSPYHSDTSGSETNESVEGDALDALSRSQAIVLNGR